MRTKATDLVHEKDGLVMVTLPSSAWAAIMDAYLDAVLEHPDGDEGEGPDNGKHRVLQLLVLLAAAAEYMPAVQDHEVTLLRETIEQYARNQFGYELTDRDRKLIRSVVMRADDSYRLYISLCASIMGKGKWPGG